MRHHLIQIISKSLLISLLIGLSISLAGAQDGGRGDKGTPAPGNRLFSDDFATFVNRWETAETSAYTIAYETQALHVQLLAPATEILTQPSTSSTIENFMMSTTVQFLAESSPDAFAGIAFGYQNPDNYYVFGVRATGHYEVRLKQAGRWVQTPVVRGYYPDLDATDESAISLKILYDAGYFELSINDTSLVPFFNDQLTAGEFGLYAFTPTDSAHIVFDDYVVFDLVYSGDVTDEEDVDDTSPTDSEADMPDTEDEEADNSSDTPPEDVELVKPPRI